MKIRFENREKFNVCGYVVETTLENNNRDLGDLWNKYERELKENSESKSCLYGVMRYTDETHQRYSYLLGIETDRLQGDMVCMEVPAGHFAVAAVPKEMTGNEAWTEFFYKGIPAKGFMPDESHGVYFEFFNKNGDYELWTPVKPIDN